MIWFQNRVTTNHKGEICDPVAISLTPRQIQWWCKSVYRYRYQFIWFTTLKTAISAWNRQSLGSRKSRYTKVSIIIMAETQPPKAPPSENSQLMSDNSHGGLKVDDQPSATRKSNSKRQRTNDRQSCSKVHVSGLYISASPRGGNTVLWNGYFFHCTELVALYHTMHLEIPLDLAFQLIDGYWPLFLQYPAFVLSWWLFGYRFICHWVEIPVNAWNTEVSV